MNDVCDRRPRDCGYCIAQVFFVEFASISCHTQKKREAKSREKAGRSRPAFNSSGLSLAEEKQCIPRKPVVAAKKASRLSDPDRCGSSYDPLEEGD
jgi:hypothetical protein